jgi:hypothetical protein
LTTRFRSVEEAFEEEAFADGAFRLSRISASASRESMGSDARPGVASMGTTTAEALSASLSV